VVLVAVVVLGGGGGEDGRGGPAAPSADDRVIASELVASLPPVSGETDREQMRSLAGPPDAFTVSLETYDDGTTVRREEWFYYDLRSVYEFADGALVSNLPLDASDQLILLPVQYDPDDFQLGVPWETVSATLPDAASFSSYQLEEAYGVDATYYVGEQLLLVFDEDGLLFYLEAVPLETGEEGS
jgi:hypothetical protein